MKAVVFHGANDIRLDTVDDPQISAPDDAIIRVTQAALCERDLHFVRGAVGTMQAGTVLGHEAVGVVEAVGKSVGHFKPGERVVISATAGCGQCSQCLKGNYSQCDIINFSGPDAGTVYFGGPADSVALHGSLADFVRVPFANNNLIKIPDTVSDAQAICLADIFPTAFYAVELAKIKYGDKVAVLSSSAVGQCVIAICRMLGASQIFAIDDVESRLMIASVQGADVVCAAEGVDVVHQIEDLTQGAMVDVVIDTRCMVSMASLVCALRLVAKSGTVAVAGMCAHGAEAFPFGEALNKNVNIVMGNCPHRRYIPHLLHCVQTQEMNPLQILQGDNVMSALSALRQLENGQISWNQVQVCHSAIEMPLS